MVRPSLVLLAVLAMGCERLGGDVPKETAGAQSQLAAMEAPAIVVEPFEPVATSRPVDAPLRVLVGGDLIPHRPSLAAPSAIAAALAPLAPVFGQADAVVANFEAATGALDKKAFRLAYAAPPEWLDALPLSGISAISVANNHACDLDYQGVEATLDAATKSGLVALGGDTNGDPWQPQTLVERDGKRVCAVAWTTLVNAPGGCARTVRLAVATENAAGRQKIASAMQRARLACDATVAIIHGGVEYAPQTPQVMTMARQAADAGADAVVIHHPHVPSPVVVHATKDGRNIPIFASVGNLVSNQGESWKLPMFPVLRENRRLVCVNGWTRLGLLADLAFDLQGDAPRLDWSFHLVWTENEHADDRTVPVPKITTRLLEPEKDSALLARLSQDALGPVDLFDDPCWVERPLYTEGDRQQSPRCSTTLVRSAPRPGLVAASARARKKR